MSSAAGRRKMGGREGKGNGVAAAAANLVRDVVDNAVVLVEDVVDDSMRVARAVQEFLREAGGA